MSDLVPTPLRTRWNRAAFAFAQRHPVWMLSAIVVFSNLFATWFNIEYNKQLIVDRYMTASQKQLFFRIVLVYNPIAFAGGLALVLAAIWPIARHHGRILRRMPVSVVELQRCRKALVNLPLSLVCINSLAWLSGAVLFPAAICGFDDAHGGARIWPQFIVSFFVGMGLTVVQTLFLTEEFLIQVLYPVYFRDARPADTPGGWRFPFLLRLVLFWAAVAFCPMLAIMALAGNVADPWLQSSFYWTVVGGMASGGFISLLVGRSLRRWLREHSLASERIMRGDLTTRIREKRPDQWGRLSDRFNDMAAGLEQAEKVRETFGQIVHPELRDALVQRYRGLGGAVQEVTVMFVDIRGFTRRSAGAPPEQVVALLNRFLTLAVAAVEDQGGWVNKFLGDGVLALFGIRRAGPDHADQAVAAASEMLRRLALLNAELHGQGEAPLQIGIGIHTGPALVGCVGATITLADGTTTMRREITAIGETINLGQRIEQLTKTLGGPVLISECTRKHLSQHVALDPLGPQAISGFETPCVIFQLRTQAPLAG